MAERPYVTIFSTMTVDGRIASSTGFSELSCKYDLARLKLLRGAHEAVMVGANTILVDNPTLRKRLDPRTTRYYRVIVDGRLRLTPKLRIFTEPGPPVIVVTASTDKEKIAKLRLAGAEIIVAKDSETRVDLITALKTLNENYGIRSILVEGGGSLNYSLLHSRTVDELRATITPFLFGAGVSIVNDPNNNGFRDTKESPRLGLQCTELCPCKRCIHVAYIVLDKCCPPVLDKPPIEPCLAQRLQGLVEG